MRWQSIPIAQNKVFEVDSHIYDINSTLWVSDVTGISKCNEIHLRISNHPFHVKFLAQTLTNLLDIYIRQRFFRAITCNYYLCKNATRLEFVDSYLVESPQHLNPTIWLNLEEERRRLNLRKWTIRSSLNNTTPSCKCWYIFLVALKELWITYIQSCWKSKL